MATLRLKKISRGGPQNCRSLGCAREDKGEGDALLCIARWLKRTAGPSTTLRSGRDDKSVVNIDADSTTELPSRPERTRISCHASLDRAAYAPFRKERRMKLVNATKLYRESGVAQWRDLRFAYLGCEASHTQASRTLAAWTGSTVRKYRFPCAAGWNFVTPSGETRTSPGVDISKYPRSGRRS